MARELFMGSTTSLNDTGFLDVIAKDLKVKKGIELKWISKGTGEAIELGKNGVVDVLFTHDPEREMRLLQEGLVTARHTFMHNYFTLVSTEESEIVDSPETLSEVMKKIASENKTFISRGDDSGTHSKEREMWRSLGMNPDFEGYMESGSGMAKTLNLVSEQKGYALSDTGTFNFLKEKLSLKEVPLSEKSILKNIYSVLELSNICDSKKECVKDFVEYMSSEDAKSIIQGYNREHFGSPLFFLGE